MPVSRLFVLLPALMMACSDSSDSTLVTPDTTASDTADTAAEVSSSDTSSDTFVDTTSPDTASAETEDTTDIADTADTLADLADLADTDDPGLRLPVGARPVVVDWALQSEHGAGGNIDYPDVLALSDGGVALVARFNGTVTLGRFTVSGTAADRTHTLFARLDAAGEVTALTRICDRCGGYGRLVLAELPLGRVGIAGVGEGEVVLNPGTDTEVRRDTVYDLFVGVISPLGVLERWSFPGTFDGLGDGSGAGYGEVRTLVPGPDGGLAVGGAGTTLNLADGPDLTVPTPRPWSRAFIVGLSSDLTPHFAEQLGGNTSSSINLLYVTASGLIAVGDFGGWDDDIATFGAGRPGSIDLSVVSATEDPTNDLFVSRWSLPSTPGRLTARWARRIAHRSDPPRPVTWIRPLDLQSLDEGFEFRLDRANDIKPDRTGQFETDGNPPWARLVVRAGGEGVLWRFTDTVAPIEPRDDGYFSVSPRPHDSDTIWLVPSGEPRYTLPHPGSSPDGLIRDGFVLAQWRIDGRVERSGLLLTARPELSFEPWFIRAVPSLERSVLIVMLATAPLTLEPFEGEPVILQGAAPGTTSQRLIVTRVHLQ